MTVSLGLDELVEQERVGLHRAVGDDHVRRLDAVLLGDPRAQRRVADGRAVRGRAAGVVGERAGGGVLESLDVDDVERGRSAGEGDRVGGHAARVASALAPAGSAREQVREQRAAGDHDQQHDHQQHPQGPLASGSAGASHDGSSPGSARLRLRLVALHRRSAPRSALRLGGGDLDRRRLVLRRGGLGRCRSLRRRPPLARLRRGRRAEQLIRVGLVDRGGLGGVGLRRGGSARAARPRATGSGAGRRRLLVGERLGGRLARRSGGRLAPQRAARAGGDAAQRPRAAPPERPARRRRAARPGSSGSAAASGSSSVTGSAVAGWLRGSQRVLSMPPRGSGWLHGASGSSATGSGASTGSRVSWPAGAARRRRRRGTDDRLELRTRGDRQLDAAVAEVRGQRAEVDGRVRDGEADVLVARRQRDDARRRPPPRAGRCGRPPDRARGRAGRRTGVRTRNARARASSLMPAAGRGGPR